MPASTICPCGSNSSQNDCCLPFITGKKKPFTAEQLLRARYTAFTRGGKGDVDYIIETHHSKTKNEVKREGIEEWSKNSEWLGLEILEKEKGGEGDEEGLISFHVQYNQGGKPQDHREQSLFQRENGEWKFFDARALGGGTIRRTEPKVGRNDPCPCGSGKKFKKCHAQSATL
jgi:SEC-C motif domain protein